jgi:hypothetical protein
VRKTDKKTDRALVTALTEVCDAALDHVPGFQWMTHFVNYNDFPGSLIVVSVFDTDDQLLTARVQGHDSWLQQMIQDKLSALKIPINPKRQQICFDTEEACQRDNNGNWQERYR